MNFYLMLQDSSCLHSPLIHFSLIITFRNQGTSSSLPTSVTVMSTQCCQPKNYMVLLPIMASVLRCLHLLLSKPYRFSTSIDSQDVKLLLSNLLFQSTKCGSARDLKLLCADDEQTRTCWVTAMRLFKVGSMITTLSDV